MKILAVIWVMVVAGLSSAYGQLSTADIETLRARGVNPGHAMKVTNRAKAQGAILGKAMSRLESGRGLVLVLVTLQ